MRFRNYYFSRLKFLHPQFIINHMDEIKKMLHAVINAQSSLRQDLFGEIGELRKEMNGRFDKVEANAAKVEKSLTRRLDMIGKSVAYLEDDTPTREEYELLEKRVDKIEQKLTS